MIIEQGTVFKHRKGGHYVFEGVGLPKGDIITRQLEFDINDRSIKNKEQLAKSFTTALHTESNNPIVVHRRESFGSDVFYTDSNTHLVLYWDRYADEPTLYARPLAMFFDYVEGKPRFENLGVTERRSYFSVGNRL